jgi:hypothetical protein
MTTPTLLARESDGPCEGVLRGRRAVAALGAMVAGAALVGCGAAVEAPDRAVLAGSPGGTDAAAPADEEAQIDPGPSGVETPVGGRPWETRASAACAQALPGFEQVAQSADAHGVTTFWVDGRDWVVCDLPEGEDEPSLLAKAPGAGRAFTERALEVRTTRLSGPDGGVRVVAGGLLPWRVDELTYAFPDGHEEAARFVVGEGRSEQVWWVVTYTAVEGEPAEAPGSGQVGRVTVSVVGAAAEAFRVPWEDLQRRQ